MATLAIGKSPMREEAARPDHEAELGCEAGSSSTKKTRFENGPSA